MLVSHDRYLLEACADRLWLVDGGTVKPFDGDMDDYARLVLSKAEERGADRARVRCRPSRKPSARRRNGATPGLSGASSRPPKRRSRNSPQLLARVDEALAAPDAFARNPQEAARLATQREELARALAVAEEQWLEIAAEAEG